MTFRQTDPLYVIDLSDPANPVLDGELKIPGYSAYLHPVGDGLLLGVGQNATDDGRILGTQLSLFDVSDPTNPQQIDTLPIGGSSEVEWDHKAFLYWPEDGTIVLPVSPGWNSCEPNQLCLADTITGSAGGAIVAQLDGRELSSRGVITHESDRSERLLEPVAAVDGDRLGDSSRRTRPDEVLRPRHPRASRRRLVGRPRRLRLRLDRLTATRSEPHPGTRPSGRMSPDARPLDGVGSTGGLGGAAGGGAGVGWRRSR